MKNNTCITLCLLLFFLASNCFAHNDDSSIWQANRLLARTINIGYVIESPQDDPPAESIFHQLEMLKSAGFTAVRLPLNWIPAMDSSASWKIRSSFITYVERIIRQSLDLQMAVVLDNHSDEQLMNDPARYGSRIFALWEQLSHYFSKYPDSLLFELLAEPHGNVNAYWNMLTTELLKIVRVENPHRPVIIGPVNFNRPDFLSQLQLPENDRNIILSFHQYSPVRFTMQGETWFPFGKPLEWLGTPWPQKGDEEFITKMFERVEAWKVVNKRPVFLGEFGVSSMADPASACRWIAFNRQESEKLGFSWGFWSCFAKEFSLYQSERQSWNILFLKVLMPPDNKDLTDTTTYLYNLF